MNTLPLLQDPDAVELSGTVERIVFHNEENGYTVLRLLPASVNGGGGDGGLTRPRDPVSCIGHMRNSEASQQSAFVEYSAFSRSSSLPLTEGHTH